MRCESDQGRRRDCQAPVAARLTLLRQISDAPCIEGQTWGSHFNGQVWVSGGCRGDFGPAQGWVNPDYGTAANAYRCESEQGRHQECRAPAPGRQMLVRQLSETACVEGQTWGSRDGGVWVRGGCRGEFAAADWGGRSPGYGRTVVCESVEQRLNRCNWDPRWGRPALIDQLSQDSCREGRSWGYDGREIWVDRGCRGRFGAR